MVDMNERILVSAPGKVILFGEHSVVYQKVITFLSIYSRVQPLYLYKATLYY